MNRGPVSAPALDSAYGRLPLHFEPNIGQFAPQVRYVSHGGGYTLFLTDTEAVMVLSRSSERPQVEQAVVRMKLAGGRPAAQWEALEKQPGISNYFIGNDPKQWRTDVPNYGRVAARSVYPGVDLICYGNQSQLEYDLAVEPGADPRQVQLAWEGVESMKLNAEGDLVLATRLGDIVQKRPRVYQELGGKQVEVGSKYVLARGNRVRFELARYDRHRRLLIDPVVLAYSTYLGGSGDDYGRSIAVDTADSAYITGWTASTNFPTKSSYQGTYQGGNWDAFVTKLTPDGTSLVYSTYLGGNGDDYGFGIGVDATGSAYVAGHTTSTNFPTQSAYQATLKGSEAAFVTKLAPAGNALVYSTYLGGSGVDGGFAIAVDAAYSAYVAGQACSTDFPTQSAFQATNHGGCDAFVTKLAPAGNTLSYSTYLGGSGTEVIFGIAVDSLGSAYVTGETMATDFPTKSPYQSAFHGGSNDAFVTKLAPAGNALIYSTYLGGSGNDFGYSIAVDSTGAAYVTGYTTSADYPTQSPFQAALQGGQNAFVTKLTAAGNALAYSTYLGGGGEYGFGIAVAADNSAYVTGWTSSANFPILSPYQSTYQGGAYDAFVTKLAPAGNTLAHSSYLGGSGEDHGNAIALDGTGSAYITGMTASTNFPSQSAYQTTLKGTGNAFVTKFSGVGPGAFSQLAPANGQTGVSTNPTLTWGVSSGATSYYVYFGTSFPPPLVTTTTDTSYPTANLSSNTTYYWQIIALDATGLTASATWSFTTIGSAPPAAPTLLSPSNGATGVSTAPTLIWSASAGATSYDVYFGTSSLPPYFANTTATNYAVGSLKANTTYYWEILAFGGNGQAGSATWSFTTGTAVTSSGLRFVPVTPCRVVDTRNADGAFGGPTMSASSSRSFTVPESACNIPATALAYSLNVTVVPEGPLSYLTLWPTGQTQPNVSTVNAAGGTVLANAAIVPAGTGGAVSVYVTDPTDVILDINGYFDTSTGATSYAFFPATPCRVVDTRGAAGEFGGPTMQSGLSRDFPIPLGSCNVPATARAYSLNVTVVPQGPLGYLSTWPTGQSQPNVSTLNSPTGKVVANAALVPAGTNESVSVFVTNPTDVVLDINGYFGQPGTGALTFYPVTPCRIADTRNATGPFGGPEMGAGTTRSFTIPASACNIPATAAAYSLNVTVVPGGPLGYLSAWPTGANQPVVSTLNSPDGSVLANAAIVPAGTGGAIDVYVTNPTHVILDINGYFAP